jgi:hypothetical protein
MLYIKCWWNWRLITPFHNYQNAKTFTHLSECWNAFRKMLVKLTICKVNAPQLKLEQKLFVIECWENGHRHSRVTKACAQKVSRAALPKGSKLVYVNTKIWLKNHSTSRHRKKCRGLVTIVWSDIVPQILFVIVLE